MQPDQPSLEINRDLWRVTVNGRPVRLSRDQFRLLDRLVSAKAVLTVGQLIEHVYSDGREEPEWAEGALKVQIHKLRKVLAQAGAPDVIRNRWGVGYVYAGWDTSRGTAVQATTGFGDELIASTQEAVAILRGERQPARLYSAH